MDHSDIRFYFLLLAVNKFLLGLLMLHLKSRMPNIKGINEWAYGSIITAFGFFVYANYPYPTTTVIDFTFSATLASCIIGGDTIFLSGFWKFKNKPINKYILFGFPLIIVLNVFVFTIIYKVLWIRFAISSALYVVLYIISANELWKSPSKSMKLMFRWSAILYCFYAFVNLVRVVFAIKLHPTTPLVSTSFSLILVAIAGISMTLLTFNLIVIITTKLNDELQEQINTKNKLHAIISHDLRGPISNFINYTTVLKKSYDTWDTNKIKEWITHMEKASASSRFLLENLLSWSLSQLNELHVNLKQIDIVAIIHQNNKVLQQNANDKKIRLSCAAQAPVFAYADENMMNIVIRNIIANAIKFTPTNGEVIVSLVEKIKQIEIIITDSGVGISNEDLAKLFDNKQTFSTYGTANEKGSGFGLQLCKELIELNHGAIKIESTVGVGSVITVIIGKTSSILPPKF